METVTLQIDTSISIAIKMKICDQFNQLFTSHYHPAVAKVSEETGFIILSSITQDELDSMIILPSKKDEGP